MTRIKIFASNRYTLISYGNGESYALHNHPAKKLMYIQGDNATTLRNEIDAWERIDPKKPTDSILAEIWSEYADIPAAD